MEPGDKIRFIVDPTQMPPPKPVRAPMRRRKGSCSKDENDDKPPAKRKMDLMKIWPDTQVADKKGLFKKSKELI